MSRRKRIAISLVCALLVMLVCGLYASHVQDEANRERSQVLRRYGGEVVALAVARRALEAGEVVGSADVDACDWISSLAPEGALTSVDDVVGREVSVPIAANMPFSELNFRDTSYLSDIPAGHVAVSVPVTDKLGMGAGVAQGSHAVAYGVAENDVKLVAGDLIVLSSPGSGGSGFSRGALVVAVPAQSVPAVLMASANGELRLVIPADDVRMSAQEGQGSPNVEPVTSAHDAADDKKADMRDGAQKDQGQMSGEVA